MKIADAVGHSGRITVHDHALHAHGHDGGQTMVQFMVRPAVDNHVTGSPFSRRSLVLARAALRTAERPEGAMTRSLAGAQVRPDAHGKTFPGELAALLPAAKRLDACKTAVVAAAAEVGYIEAPRIKPWNVKMARFCAQRWLRAQLELDYRMSAHGPTSPWTLKPF